MTWSRSLVPMLLLLLPAWALAQVSVNISVNVAPPELPVYDQPPIPGDGYIWTPGYWAWGDDLQDYYWVPGTWVEAPQPDYLWTPGYWGAEGAVFLWHAGYWGPHVGFYGGVNYGHGYGGEGYEGGYWRGGHLFYNRSVNNISSTHITNVYNKTVINNVTVNRVSYNGGNGGVRAQATQADLAASRESHINDTPLQRQHEQAARSNPGLRAAENKGHPPIAATPRAGTLTGPGVVPARQAAGHAAQPQSAPHAQPPSQHAQRDQPQRAQPQRDESPRQATPPRERAIQPRQEIQSRPPPPAGEQRHPEQRPPQRPQPQSEQRAPEQHAPPAHSPEH